MNIGTQSTPLREIKITDEFKGNLNAKIQNLDLKTVETSEKKQEDTLSSPRADSVNKIEYKALLPQYKEFSSESEFTKSRDNA